QPELPPTKIRYPLARVARVSRLAYPSMEHRRVGVTLVRERQPLGAGSACPCSGLDDLAFAKRSIVMPVIVIRRPVGAAPASSPVWVEGAIRRAPQRRGNPSAGRGIGAARLALFRSPHSITPLPIDVALCRPVWSAACAAQRPSRPLPRGRRMQAGAKA